MAEQLPNPHPGDVLREDFMIPLELTPKQLATKMSVLPAVVEELIAGRLPVTDRLAKKLSGSVGCSEEFWVNLQRLHDEEEALRNVSSQ